MYVNPLYLCLGWEETIEGRFWRPTSVTMSRFRFSWRQVRFCWRSVWYRWYVLSFLDFTFLYFQSCHSSNKNCWVNQKINTKLQIMQKFNSTKVDLYYCTSCLHSRLGKLLHQKSYHIFVFLIDKPQQHYWDKVLRHY